MSRLRRVRSARGLVLIVALAALIAPACSKNKGDSEEVRKYLDDTNLLSHRFVYTETAPGGTTTVVQGLIEDDFRYKARLIIGDAPVLDRVVSDDIAAVRFLAPQYLARFVDKKVAPEIDTETNLDGIDVYAALQSGRWVIDHGGAPPQLRKVDELGDSGEDPVFDALEMLGVARNLTLLGWDYIKYSKDSISPTFRTDEDPFPVPEEGSGVDRFDMPSFWFPEFGGDTGEVVLPDEGQFRKVAVYVKDGRVIRVMIDVGLSPSLLDNFERYMTQLVNETAPPEVQAGFAAEMKRLEGEAKGLFLLNSLNVFRDLRGDPPVRFRTSSYELLDIGAEDIAVDVPTTDVIEGDLAVLLNLGNKPPVAEDGTEEDQDEAAGSADIAAVLGGPGPAESGEAASPPTTAAAMAG